VIKNVMLKDTVDGEFTTVEDVAAAALLFASFGSNALTGTIPRRQPRLVHAVKEKRFNAEDAEDAQRSRRRPPESSP
jgi:hypothetical protein